jgi:hypothetical protein
MSQKQCCLRQSDSPQQIGGALYDCDLFSFKLMHLAAAWAITWNTINEPG